VPDTVVEGLQNILCCNRFLNCSSIYIRDSTEVASRITYEVAIMQIRSFTLAYGIILTLVLAGSAVAQENRDQQPSAREQFPQIYTPQSIDQELTRLTKDLELTPEQQQMVRLLLQQHHDKIQALLDNSLNASRQDLGPQTHAISDETHRQIHALLTDRQKELEKAMQQREHSGEENREPAPPAAEPPDPSLSIS
jgi:DNA anti-recombination protein RmuC